MSPTSLMKGVLKIKNKKVQNIKLRRKYFCRYAVIQVKRTQNTKTNKDYNI